MPKLRLGPLKFELVVEDGEETKPFIEKKDREFKCHNISATFFCKEGEESKEFRSWINSYKECGYLPLSHMMTSMRTKSGKSLVSIEMSATKRRR